MLLRGLRPVQLSSACNEHPETARETAAESVGEADPMRVAIDGIVFSLQPHGGISVYFRQLLTRLARDRIACRLTLEDPTLQPAPATLGVLSEQHRRARLAERYRPARISAGASVFHSSYYRRPSRHIPCVVTVHDFTYERCRHGLRRWVHSAQKFAAIRAADAIICVSAATRDDMLDLVGTRAWQQLSVIRNGVDVGFKPVDHLPTAKPFVLFVGQRAGYKNFGLLAEAMTLLPDLELLCVGGGAFRPSELERLPGAVRTRIRHLGHVDDRDLNRLYNQALCLAYPSTYEGFGIPVVEAMRAGCPVVCVACKAVLEIGGDALSVSEPDPASMAERITSLRSPAARDTMARAGLDRARLYDWEQTYLETLRVYRTLAGA